MLGRWRGAFWTVWFLLLRGYYSTIIDLGNMLRLMTNRNPLEFINYGNYCGLGGSGYVMDEIDRCCKIHDFCYDKIIQSGCTSDEKPYVAFYKWKYAAGKVLCNKRNSRCGLATCRCDGKFSACVQVHEAVYDPRKKRSKIPVLSLSMEVDKKKK